MRTTGHFGAFRATGWCETCLGTCRYASLTRPLSTEQLQPMCGYCGARGCRANHPTKRRRWWHWRRR